MQNPKKRKLAAILFADIVGYTALMQTNEELGSQMVQKFRTTLNEKVIQYQGQVIQYYGDGCLCTFDSAVDAMNCAKEVQQIFLAQPAVPVRIGVHSGDVYFEADNVYGNSVNIASRIESLGVAGAVLFSKEIKRHIANQRAFYIQSVGEFDFKNVNKAMEVFALADEGLVVPSKAQLKGKGKQVTIQGSFFQRIWDKKIPQLLSIYIFLAWLGLQLFDWALDQFGISPHWAQIFFISVLGIIPTLLVYLNNRDRIHQGQWKWAEKIIIPSNLILLGTALFVLFRGVDLGATTNTVTFINSQGEEETRTIVKQEFRKEVCLFPFDPMEVDSVEQWIGKGIPDFLDVTLGHNKYLSPQPYAVKYGRSTNRTLARVRLNTSYNTSKKIELAKGFNGEQYVDGQYTVINGEYHIMPTIRNRKNGQPIKKQAFIGRDLMALLDSTTQFINTSLGLSKEEIADSPMFKLSDCFTNNITALRHYANARNGIGWFGFELEKAIAADSTFATAYKELALDYYRYGVSHLESKYLINQAFKYRDKLSYDKKMAVLLLKHRIEGADNKLEKLAKLQLESAPLNETYTEALSDLYFRQRRLNELLSFTRTLFVKDPSPMRGWEYCQAAFMNGEATTEEALFILEKLKFLDSKNIGLLEILTETHLHLGNYDKALDHLENISLLNPELDTFTNQNIAAARYLKAHSEPNHNKDISGTYCDDSRGEYCHTYSFINGQLYADWGHTGLFLFKSDSLTYKRGIPTFPMGFIHQFLKNKKGEVYLDKFTQTQLIMTWDIYYWKQDSLIWTAQDLLRAQQYEAAAAAYDKAIAAHPEHYYLQLARQHIDYLQQTPSEVLQEEYQAAIGRYGDQRKLWIENGQLFYKKDGDGRKILRPISAQQYISLNGYNVIRELDIQGDQVRGLQNYEYDWEVQDFVKQEEAYYEKVGLRD